MGRADAERARARADDERWVGVLARDASRRAEFVYSVSTTGVYCRPGCAARTPKRENVAFYDTPAEAAASGFRPCKRCKPTEPPLSERHRVKVAEACRMIESAEDAPSLETLALTAGLSPHHFHRVFKSIVGVTPKAYAVAHRQKRVRAKLARSNTVTEGIHDGGFHSSGRFYADANQILGMTPTEFRAGGLNADIRYAVERCSLGRILVAATAKGVCAIFLGDDETTLIEELRARFAKAKPHRG